MSELRGICLGDSIVFGAGLNDAETIPAQLSAIVSKKLGRSFECLNIGVSNYTTVQEVALFRHVDALRFDPSVVVIGIFTNDFTTSMGRIDVVEGEARLVSPGAPAWLARSLESLRVVRLAAVGTLAIRDSLRRIGLYPQANAKALRPEQIAAVYGALDELRALLEPRGIPLVLLLFPRDWQLGARDREAASERASRIAIVTASDASICSITSGGTRSTTTSDRATIRIRTRRRHAPARRCSRARWSTRSRHGAKRASARST